MKSESIDHLVTHLAAVVLDSSQPILVRVAVASPNNSDSTYQPEADFPSQPRKRSCQFSSVNAFDKENSLPLSSSLMLSSDIGIAFPTLPVLEPPLKVLPRKIVRKWKLKHRASMQLSHRRPEVDTIQPAPSPPPSPPPTTVYSSFLDGVIKTPENSSSLCQCPRSPPAALRLRSVGNATDTMPDLIPTTIKARKIERVKHYPAPPFTPLKFYHCPANLSSPLRSKKICRGK